MGLGRGRRDRGGIDAWPGYVDALSTLLILIIFVLLVFVLSQGFLSVALSSRDRALDRLNRQVAELGELLALERGQAEELRSTLGRTNDELRAAASARDTALRNLSLLRDERDRLATERDSSRGERDQLAARLADLEAAARGGSARVADLEGRLAEALARAESVGGDAARTARTLTDAQRLLAAERAALEAVRRDLSATRDQAAVLGRDLDAERRAREARERDLAAAQSLGQGLTRELASEREAREARERELEASRGQAQALTRELAETRSARDANQRALAASRQDAEALNRDLAQRRQEAEALARDLAAARQQLEAARRDIARLREEASKLDQTVQADRATIEARLSDIAGLSQQVRALEALRDQLERQAAEAIARAGEQERQRSAAQAAAAEAARRAAEADTQRTAAQRAAEEAARARAAAEALVAQATGRSTEAERAAADAARRAAEADTQRSAAQRAAEEAARARAAAEALVAQATGRSTAAERAAAEAERQRAAAALLAADATARAAEAERRRQAAEGQSGEFARLSESARAQVALLTRQLEQLRSEIGRLSAALDLAETEGRDRDAQIAVLGQRLNAALAARVEELQSYRSDFFGRLRRVLGDRPEIRIAGDRFVFQSEVLFPIGSAELSAAGQQQIRDLGRVLIDLSAQFPRDLNWVLRVDGHADRSPIRGGGRFANNWELSAARSIAVAQLLIEAGLPRNRVAAAAFGDTQPLDDRDTPDAYARNRRIELRLEAGPAPNAADAPAAPAPATTPAPATPATPATRGPRDALGTLECARVALAETPEGARALGIGQRGTTARLRATLPAGTRLAVAEFEGPYCGVLQALPPAAGTGGPGVAVVGGTTLPRRSLLRVDVTLPDFAAELLLVFIANDGQVVQLQRLDRQQAGARLRIGEPRGDFAGWAVDEPLGTDLVLAIASEGALFATPRPETETVESFAPALRAAVAAAQAAGRRVTATVAVVEVVPP